MMDIRFATAENNGEFRYYGIASSIFLAAVFLKQFYLFGSGGFQIGDLMFVLAFIGVLLSKKMDFRIAKADFPFALFVVLTIFINLLHFALFNDSSFLMPCAYYTFNLMIILSFRYIGSDERFLSALFRLIRFIYIFQLILYFTNAGRWYDASRYMGTFNDPNQYGFYILSLYFMAHLIGQAIKKRVTILDDALVLMLLISSLSTGMLLGYGFLVATKYIFLPLKSGMRIGVIKTIASVGLVVILGVIALVVPADGSSTSKVEVAAGRVLEKISKLTDFSVDSDYSESIVLDRNLDKIILYPEEMIFGSGEGGWSRFEGARNDHEIHSTWLGILFCYGIAPFVLLVYWVRNNALRKIGGSAPSVEMAVIIESLFLANQRQPFFWMLLAFAPADAERGTEKEKRLQ